MIRLRRTLERGRKHPILGPIVLILLVLLLVMVFLHTAQDDYGAALETGFLCLAIVMALGPIVVRGPWREPRSSAVPVARYRGPPTHVASLVTDEPAGSSSWRAAPLRR